MMKKKLIITSVLVLIMLSVLFSAGCGVSKKQYDTLNAELTSVQKQYLAAQSELESVKKSSATTKAELESVKQEYSTTKSQLTAAQDEIKKVQGTVGSQTLAVTQAQTKISELDKTLKSTLDTKMVQYYKFYFGKDYLWKLPLTLRTYFDVKAKSRSDDVTKFAAMATDPDADSLLNLLVSDFKDEAIARNLNQLDSVHMVAAFIQSLGGIDRSFITPYDTVPRYPLETLIEQQGDCVDTSILYAAILFRYGFDVAFLVFEGEPKHVALGVNLSTYGKSWELKGKTYYYLETTGGNWRLGDCPLPYQNTRPAIYPIPR